MGKVAVAIKAIGKPQAKSWKHQRFVQPDKTGRMAVQNFMLEMAMPADQDCPDRNQSSDRQRGMPPGQGKPGCIDRDSNGPGRQFQATPQGDIYGWISHALT